MNWLIALLSVVMVLGGVHIFLRVLLVELAKKHNFFTSPNIGRIQQRIRGGRVVGYLANLKGLTEYVDETDESSGQVVRKRKFVDIDEETGETIKVDKPIWRGICWAIYGVRFIGLDDIQDYDLEITRIEPDGSVKTELVKAHSLHYSGIYPVVLEGRDSPETLEGIPVNLRLRITTRTHHAGHCLKYKSQWLNKILSAVKAALRDFVGKSPIRDLLKMQNEKPENNVLGLVAFIRSLNTGEVGNSGLIDTLGQEIIDVNLESIEIDPETAEAMKQEKLAQERSAGELAEATRQVAIATQNKERIRIEAEAEAKRISEVGNAENAVLEGRRAALQGVDGLVGLAKWDAVKVLKDLKGTLVLSDEPKAKAPSILLPTGMTSKEVRTNG